MSRSLLSNIAVASLAIGFICLVTSFAGAQCPDSVAATCPDGFYMADISWDPGPVSQGLPSTISISGGTGSGPVTLLNSAVEVDGTTVRISTWFELGPWAMPSGWTETFSLPSLDTGTYRIEFLIWDESSQEMVLNATSVLQVSPPVPAQGPVGIAVMVSCLAFGGFWMALRRQG